LHSPSFIRETNPEQLEHNGDQPFLAIFSAFLDNNIKPTQTFGNTFTPFINTDSHANIEFAKCLSSKKPATISPRMVYTPYSSSLPLHTLP